MSNYDLNLFQDYQTTSQILEIVYQIAVDSIFVTKHRYLYSVVLFNVAKDIEMESLHKYQCHTLLIAMF